MATLIVLLFNVGQAFVMIAFLWSLRHASTVIVAIVALGFLLRCLDDCGLRSRLGLLLAVGTGIASDMLFVPMFVAPALGVLACLWLLDAAPARRLAVSVGSIGAACLTGWIVFRALAPIVDVSAQAGLDVAGVIAGLGNLARDFVSRPIRVAYALAVLAALALQILTLRRGLRRHAPLERTVALALFGVLLVLAQGLAVVATGKPLGEDGYLRYMLPVYVAATLTLSYGAWVALARLLRQSSTRTAWAVVGLVALGLGHSWRSVASGTPLAFAYYPPVVRCLDQLAVHYDLRYGVADYWLAKVVRVTSRQGLRVYPVNPDLEPHTTWT